MSKSASSAGQARPTQAEQADRHTLYQKAVQDVEAEIDFVDETYYEERGRRAKWLREDFCGTANTSCEWVRRRRTNHAIGVDNDADPLEWGTEHNLGALPSAARNRVELVQEDVITVETPDMDVILAMNFSYYLFLTRTDLRRYFRRVYHSLADDGIFFMDAYGGYDAPKEIEESRDCDGFTYIWDQADFDPVSGQMTCYIHFELPDGSRMDRAFAYRWRLWTLPELQEVLKEAGFTDIDVYWEGTDEETGEGNGLFEPVDRGDADAGWICYLVAKKGEE